MAGAGGLGIVICSLLILPVSLIIETSNAQGEVPLWESI